MSDKSTLILGIGNTLLSDEGVGVQMLEYLRDSLNESGKVDFLDGGTLSFTLAPWIEEADNLVVIDAAELGDVPGAVRVFEGPEMDSFAGKTRRSVHEVSLGDLLAIAHLTGSMPVNRALVAIQPWHVDWGHEMSAPVRDAQPVAARIVSALLDSWSCDSRQPASNGRETASRWYA